MRTFFICLFMLCCVLALVSLYIVILGIIMHFPAKQVIASGINTATFIVQAMIAVMFYREES